MGLVSELRRRNVFRMAVLYVVAAWLIMQVAEVLIVLAKLPDWVGPTTLVLLAVGFPIALVFSWFYEITPEGISLEKHVEPGKSITHVTGRRLDFLVISLLCAAVILFAYDKWWIGPPPEKSIAVLAFENLSGDPGQEYLSDGVSEEILNTLAHVPELRVISRSSAFSFKEKSVAIPEIARQLNVAHVLEGSVRRTGNRIRVTAQLIEASSDTHLWSETFDRSFDDIFVIQDEIAAAITDALKLRLILDSGEAELPTDIKSASTAAYDVYLKALDLKGGGLSRTQELVRLLEHSLRLDNNFAPAHARLAGAILSLQDGFGYHGNLSREEALRRAIPHLERAAELEPNLDQVHVVRALIAFDENERESVIRHAQKALAVNPSHVGAMNLMAIALQDLDRYEEMLEVYDQMLAVDPLSILGRSNYIGWLCEMGRIDEAREMAHQLLADDRWMGYRKLGELALLYEGKVAEAVSWFLKAHAEDPESSTSNRLLVNALILLDEYEEARRIGSRFATDVNIAEGRFLAAIQATRTKLQLDPLNQRMILSAAETLYQAGRIDEALPLFERLRELGPEGAPIAMNYTATAHLAVARKRAGDESGARAAAQILRKSLSAYRQAFGKSFAAHRADALLAALDDDRDGVIAALKAVTETGFRSPQLFADVIFEDLWADERFVSLQQELDDLLAEEHEKYLQLVCFNNPVPDDWRPLPETCDGVIEQPVL